MPTKREREYYARGFTDGVNQGKSADRLERAYAQRGISVTKPTRKLSAWQKYIKNKRNHITFRDGKLNLKKMGVQYRKKKRR